MDTITYLYPSVSFTSGAPLTPISAVINVYYSWCLDGYCYIVLLNWLEF